MHATILAVAVLLAPPAASETAQGVATRPDDVERSARLSGRVVDTAGKPVSGAEVWTHGSMPRVGRASVLTGGDGTFTIDHAHPDAWFAFVTHDGYRETGRAIPRDAERLEIRLTRRDAAIDPLLTSRPAKEQRAKVLKDLLRPVYERMLAEQNDYLAGQILERLAPYDRQYAVDRVLDLRDEQWRAALLLALGEIDDSLEQAARIRDVSSRVHAHLSTAAAVRDPARKRRILGEALVHARQELNPARRIALFASIAGGLFDAGERDAAESLLADTLAPATELPYGHAADYPRGRFAEAFALIDPQESLALVAAIKGPDARNQYHGHIACRLAASDPEQAEQVLSLLHPVRRREHMPRVCFRMAAADLERARKLAAEVTDRGQRACIYGAMAVALGEQQPDVARRLLREAFAIVRQGPDYIGSNGQLFSAGAVLLRFAEQVDPQLAASFLWPVVALHPGPTADYSFRGDRADLHRDAETAKLVLRLALYGREPDLCRELMEPVFERAENWESKHCTELGPITAAMILVEPQRAVAWHNRFFSKVEAELLQFTAQPWLAMSAVLAESDEAAWRWVQNDIFLYRVIDADGF